MSASAAQAYGEVEQQAEDGTTTDGPGWRLTVYFALLVAIVTAAAVAATVFVFVQTDRDSRNMAHGTPRSQRRRRPRISRPAWPR